MQSVARENGILWYYILHTECTIARSFVVLIWVNMFTKYIFTNTFLVNFLKCVNNLAK